MVFLYQLQITTARKAVTLLLSYLIFTKPLTEQHGTGLLLIAMGIVLKLLPDSNPHKKASKPTLSKVGKITHHLDEKTQLQSQEEEEKEEKRPLI